MRALNQKSTGSFITSFEAPVDRSIESTLWETRSAMLSSITNQIVSNQTIHHILEEISEAFCQNGRIQIYRLFLLLDPTIDRGRDILY